MIKDFPGIPNFDSIICATDIKEYFDKEIKKTEDLSPELKGLRLKQIESIMRIKIMVLDIIPSNTAFFVDHVGKIVAVYKDGKIVIIPQDKIEIAPKFPPEVKLK